MSIILLKPLDVMIAFLLVVVLAVLTTTQKLGLGRSLIVAGMRTIVQLFLIGMVLKALFEHVHLVWIAGIATVMLLVAAYEVMMRQERRFSGRWGFGVGAFSLFLSSLTVTLFGLNVVIMPEPWYTPQYAIPLLGMMLGNTMTGVALAMDRLTQEAWRQRRVIEARLLMGQTWREAIGAIRKEAMRTGMIPTINAMAAAGVVSLPGMMTGQILAGSSPMVAVQYQIVVMFLITAGTGFGTIAAVDLGSRHLFDHRQRLRLDRLKT